MLPSAIVSARPLLGVPVPPIYFALPGDQPHLWSAATQTNWLVQAYQQVGASPPDGFVWSSHSLRYGAAVLLVPRPGILSRSASMAVGPLDRQLCRLCICVCRSGPVLALTSSSLGSRPGLPGPLVLLSPSLLPPFCDGLRLLAGKRSLPPENCQWHYRLLEVLLPYLFGALQRTVRACSAPPFLIISGGVLTPYKSLRLPRSSIFRFCRTRLPALAAGLGFRTASAPLFYLKPNLT